MRTIQAYPRARARLPEARLGPRRRWWPWITAAVLLPLLALLAASVYFVVTPAAPAPLALPARAVAPAGPVSGTWGVGRGSLAGFRLAARAVGISNDVVGRTSAVTGSVAVSGDWVTAARLRIGLTAIRVNGRKLPQFADSLRTRRHPVATFSLTEVATLGRAFTAGRAVSRRVAGFLDLNGTACAVTVTISARRNGSALQVAGTIPVDLAYWGIKNPAGAGLLGSLADQGTAEFLLTLHRQS
jgi:YceI-like domain